LGVVLLFVGAHRAAADTQELAVLLVIDTNSSKVSGDDAVQKAGTTADHNTWRTFIDDVYKSEWPKYKGRLTLDVLKGDDVSPAKIRQYYVRQPYKKDRALVFYYSGHGGYDQKTGHFFATSGGNMLRSEVYQLMNDLGPPAIFLLSDCCSNYADVGLVAAQSAPQSRQVKTINWKAFNNLFFQTEGVVNVTASTRGEMSWFNANTGGYFTTALAHYLYQPSSAIRQDGNDGNVSWNDYFGRVQAMTASIFKTNLDAAAPGSAIKKQAAQTPEALVLGQWPTQYRRQLVVKNATGKTIRVWVQYYDLNFTTNQWQWYYPTDNGKSYKLENGKATTLRDQDWLVGANVCRIWAATEDGSVVWNEYKTKEMRLAPQQGYSGPFQQFTFTFNP
jgi:hypothetical protein